MKKNLETSGIAGASSNPQDGAASSRRLPPHAPPTGTITFLFTDIEGSTALWEGDPKAMQGAIARQEAIVRETMADHGGYVYKMIGDAFQVAFSTAPAAVAGAVDAQRALHAEPWGPIGALRVRMALHTGVTEERSDDYVGPELNRIARILSAGYGGQVLLSQATADLLNHHLPNGVVLRDLGEHYLRDLIQPEHIYQVEAPDLPSDFPPLKSIRAESHHLPSPTTRFMGREDELNRIEALLRDPNCRLISLVGLGGSGKTRLSIQAAAQATAFPQGVHFVSLAAVNTLEGVISGLAEALQMPFYVRPRTNLTVDAAQAQVLSHLTNKKILLVFDNCEHLLGEEEPELVEFIAELLTAAPGVKLIATSRERLNLPGEWVLEITGLSFPRGDEREDLQSYAAVQLFAERAQRTGSFAADTADASTWSAIARICQLLGGMPLGVEMAAAWTKVLSCQEIAAELERDMLSLIATWRTAPQRHRTLRTVFDHSWHILSNQERDVYAKLSVFQGRFRREAAAEVAAASLPTLSRLIDTSFLHRDPDGRFETHPALRRYAAEKLASDPAAEDQARARHAHYYTRWLCEMYGRLKGTEPITALAALQDEARDLHDAWRWMIEQREGTSLPLLLPGMILFHEMRGRPVEAQEIIGLLHGTLGALGYVPGGDSSTLDPEIAAPIALAMAAVRHFSQTVEPPERTHAYQTESLKIAEKLPDGESKGFTFLLNCMGPGLMTTQETCALCERCIAIFRDLGNTWGMALAELIQADTAGFIAGDYPMARPRYESSLRVFTDLGNDWGRALCLTGLAYLERQEGHLEKAYEMECESLNIYLRMGDMWRAVRMCHDLGEIAEALGAFDEARRYYESNMEHFARMGDERSRDHYRARLQSLRAQPHAAGPGLDTQESDPAPDEAAVRKALSPLKLGSGIQPTAEKDEIQVEPLTPRETEVLCLLAEGLSNREIARRLYLSPNTVRVHTYHIYGKLGVKNRTQAAARGRALDLLPPSAPEK